MFRSWTSAFYKAMSVIVVVLIAVTMADLLKAKPYNVIVLTIDSLRASDFTPQTAPHFFDLMKDAAVSSKHRAVSAWTAPNIIAVLTGISPFDQGVHARGQSLPENADVPLGQLEAKGWKVGNVQAFALIDVFKNIGVTVDTQSDWKHWLISRIRHEEPFVLWHHYLDVHLPYSPATATIIPDVQATSPQQQARIDVIRTRSAIPMGSVQFEAQDRALIRDLYLGGIQQFDDWFVDFWKFFTATGLDQDTILIVTADHGEERLERGRVGHASTTHDASLHEEIVSIPLLVLLPQRHPLRKAGFELDKGLATDHLDIMPTLLSLMGVTPSSPLAGRDLTVDQQPRPWFAYSSKGGYGEPDPEHISSFVAAYLRNGQKLMVRIEDGKVTPFRFYDLRTDPLEQNDLLSKGGGESPGPSLNALLAEAGFGESGLGELSEKILSARKFVPEGERRTAKNAIPVLLWPKEGGRIGYDDMQGRFMIEWSGDTSTNYVLDYELGSPPFSLAGEMRVAGDRKSFGEIDRHYWNTWVVPYGKARVRVRQEGGDEWSKWYTFVFRE